MPLTASKLAHLNAKLAILFDQRAQQVTLTLKNADGSTTTLTINGIFRLGADFDPTMDLAPHGSELKGADAILMVHEADVTYAQIRACIYVTVTTPAGADAMASRYIVTSIEPKGMGPGGDRYILSLDRQRP